MGNTLACQLVIVVIMMIVIESDDDVFVKCARVSARRGMTCLHASSHFLSPHFFVSHLVLKKNKTFIEFLPSENVDQITQHVT